MDKFLNLINGLIEYLKEYGAEGVFWFAVCGYIVTLVFPNLQIDILSSNNVLLLGMLSLGIKFSRRRQDDDNAHRKGNEVRLMANLNVRNELLNIKSDLNAARVYVLEMHNGNKNNANLPFLFADMTFEETTTSNDISKEFQNINLSLFPFAEYIFKNKIYIGHVSGLKEIDRKFYNRVAEQGTEYCAMSVLHHGKHLIGIVGVSIPYAITEESKTRIYDSLINHGAIISDYLTYKE